jgi:hypothetical protein
MIRRDEADRLAAATATITLWRRANAAAALVGRPLLSMAELARHSPALAAVMPMVPTWFVELAERMVLHDDPKARESQISL